MLRSWFDHVLPARVRYGRALAEHHAGRARSAFRSVRAEPPSGLDAPPLSIFFWTPHPWPSTDIHVGRVLPHLRALVSALGLPWRVGSGADLPREAVDWLLCMKAIPPSRPYAVERTVLMINDDADRIWHGLARFDHVVSVSSPVLASLIAGAHPRVWFIEESEADDAIAQGKQALKQRPPSQRKPLLLWNGTKESLEGLLPLREVLEAFAAETGARLSIVTNRPEGSEQWGALPVRHFAWSPQVLAEQAAQARTGIVPARPTVADSYLKSAGRLRCFYALGCPGIGDARSPDVAAFSNACDIPSAASPAEWLTALRQLWSDPVRLDAAATRGHALVSERFAASRTARQWLWFFANAERESAAVSAEASAL